MSAQNKNKTKKQSTLSRLTSIFLVAATLGLGSAITVPDVAFAHGESNNQPPVNQPANQKDQKDLWVALMNGIDNRDMNAIKHSLKDGANVNTGNEAGQTPLMSAVSRGYEDIAKILLDHNADVNIKAHDGATALMIASYEGHANLINILMEKNPDMAAHDKYGNDVVMIAVMGEKKESVRVLLENGAPPGTANRDGQTPLMLTATTGQHEIMDILLQNKADANTADKTGMTALMHLLTTIKTIRIDLDRMDPVQHMQMEPKYQGIKGKYLSSMKSLLGHGANVNIQDPGGLSALMISASMNESDITRFLLDNGADAKAQDANRFTALAMAALTGDIESVKTLLEKGANPSVKIEPFPGAPATIQQMAGIKPADLAMKSGFAEIADMITQAEQDYIPDTRDRELASAAPTAPTIDANDAFMNAILSGDLSSVQAALEDGADVNTQDENGMSALTYSSTQQNKEIMTLLLEKGAKIDLTDTNGMSALHFSVMEGQIESVKLLLEKGASADLRIAHPAGDNFPLHGLNAVELASSLEQNPKAPPEMKEKYSAIANYVSDFLQVATVQSKQEKEQKTVEKTQDQEKLNNTLMAAVQKGDLDVIKQTVKDGADLNIRDKRGRTPLMFAANAGNREITALFLKNGAHLESKSDMGATALMAAVSSHSLETATLLLDQGAYINARDNYDITSLMLAVMGPDEAIVKLLLDRGADITARVGDNPPGKLVEWKNYTAQEIAQDAARMPLKKRADFARIAGLFEHYKNPLERLSKTNDALINAAASGDLKQVETTLKQGASTGAWDKTGRNALVQAVKNGHSNIVNFLLERAGTNINIQNGAGMTPLMAAASDSHTDIMNALLEKKADVALKDHRGRTALLWAIIDGNDKGSVALLEKGANPDDRYANGWTPLMVAARDNMLETAYILTEKKADVNAADKKGLTALMVAASHGYDWITQILVQNGADISAQYIDGKTAIDAARENGHTGVVTYLEKQLKPAVKEPAPKKLGL